MFKRKNVALNRPSGPASARGAPEIPAKQHPGVRPSLVNSKPCVSSSSRSLDRALAHGGVPTGTLTMIEEHGTTDFASALLKSLCSLSIAEFREGNESRVICVGIPEWLRALPSISKKSRSSSSSNTIPNGKMKIAWRYAKYASDAAGAVESASSYCKDVDFKSTMIPAAQGSEVSYILGQSLNELITKLETELKRIPKSTVVRIVVPSFLHPAIYPASASTPQNLFPFFSKLRKLVASHGNAVALITMPLQLYPRTHSVVSGLELLCDNCIELEPFDSGDDNVHGFLHINRLAFLSDRGEMVEQRRELSFKLGRHQFEVEPYAIPVELEEEKPNEKEDW